MHLLASILQCKKRTRHYKTSLSYCNATIYRTNKLLYWDYYTKPLNSKVGILHLQLRNELVQRLTHLIPHIGLQCLRKVFQSGGKIAGLHHDHVFICPYMVLGSRVMSCDQVIQGIIHVTCIGYCTGAGCRVSEYLSPIQLSIEYEITIPFQTWGWACRCLRVINYLVFSVRIQI